MKKKGEIIKNYIETEILPLDSRLSVRGIGMIWGIEFEKIDYRLSKVAAMRCFENGLLIERAGRRDSVLKPMPALTIPEEDLMKGLAIVRDDAAFGVEEYGIAVRKGNPGLLKMLNETVDGMLKSGKIAELAVKYGEAE